MNKNLITAAINLNLIDVADLIDMMCQHNNELGVIVTELGEIADALRHTDPTKRAAWIAVCEAVHFLANDTLGTADKFGFRAEARAKAHAALAAAELSVAS